MSHDDRSVLREHAASFDRAADVYEASRPSYPAEAVAWLVADAAGEVLDLGAGTGKLTRSLIRPGRTVHAVDPSPEMLRVLAEKVPDAVVAPGTGESIPLPDGSVDAVVVAQAWHWMDTARTVPEVARVLRPGGTLGLVWNSRDERIDWVRELGEAMGSNDRYSPAAVSDHPAGAPFEPGEIAEFGWAQRLDRDELLALVTSRSYYLVKPPSEQQAVLRAVEELLERHPRIVDADGVIELPYITQAFRFRRA